MRNYRNVLAALVFVFALSAPAFADDGIMTSEKTTPGIMTPENTSPGIMYPEKASTTTTADGTSSTASDATADNSITAAVISLAQNALALI